MVGVIQRHALRALSLVKHVSRCMCSFRLFYILEQVQWVCDTRLLRSVVCDVPQLWLQCVQVLHSLQTIYKVHWLQRRYQMAIASSISLQQHHQVWQFPLPFHLFMDFVWGWENTAQGPNPLATIN